MIAYFDCYSGISGDMVLGALVDAGVPLEEVRRPLATMPLTGYSLRAEASHSGGLRGTRFRVDVDDAGAAPRRSLRDIVSIIRAGSLSPSVRERAEAIFARLARAEARVHGVQVEDVHFHEVGAVDAIVDVVGVCVGLEWLGVDRVYASSLPVASGEIQTGHGPLPLPSPAVLELLSDVGASIRPARGQQELVTPTGAAILAELATFQQPEMVVRRTGYGLGSLLLPWPNVLRIWLGDRPATGFQGEEVVLLETNLDDASPQVLGYTMARLFDAGALDVFFTPIQMKKNRPGVLLSALALPTAVDHLAEIMLTETPSLGVRFSRMERLVVPRRVERVQTPLGEARVKIKVLRDREEWAPEFEDCARLARERGLTLAEVYGIVQTAAETALGKPGRTGPQQW